MLQELEVDLVRSFRAPREAVFAAWTRPEELVQWIGPQAWNPFAEVDLRVGGAYRMGMTMPSGEIISVIGRYLEISPPDRLVFTWAWVGDGERVTQVTVTLRDLGGLTELRLVHTGFTEADDAENHRLGWTSWFDRLEVAAPKLADPRV